MGKRGKLIHNGIVYTGGGGTSGNLADLNDVVFTNLAEGHGIIYDGTNWVNFGAKIVVEYVDDFKGQTITCTQGTVTYSQVAPNDANSITFLVPSTGSWEISSTYSGNTYTTNATVTALGTAVSAQLQIIPDGDTVTPTDDIQKWLNCAGIFDKVSYTTLSDILSDSITFNALLGDSNACKYMARSTTWASTLCADQYAMCMIGQYDVCCDALLGNSTWLTAIANSTYMEYVLNIKVPTMTSNTTPSGECITSNEQPSYKAYNAFDSSVYSTIWATVNGHTTNEYVGYDFGSAVKVSRVGIINSCYASAYYNQGVQDFEIKGSDDNSTWHTVYTGKATQATSTSQAFEYFDFNSDDAYRYWIILCKNNYGASDAIVINQLQFYGHASSGEKIHGANEEVAYYLDGTTQVPISNPSTLDVGTYTFGSTIAKNPDNLSSDYTKQIKITPNTVEVVLRPDNALYWYGYNKGMIQNTDGVISYEDSDSNTVGSVSFGTNSITLSTSQAMCNAEVKTGSSVDLTTYSSVKIIANPCGIGNFEFGTHSGKTAKDYKINSTNALISDSVSITDKTVTSVYAGFYYYTSTSYIYALWLE